MNTVTRLIAIVIIIAAAIGISHLLIHWVPFLHWIGFEKVELDFTGAKKS